MGSRRHALRLLETAKTSFPRVEPPCPHFNACGGCHLQDLAYGDQLALKRAALTRALAPLGALPSITLVGLDDPWRYRNKMEFTFGQQDGLLVLGMHRLGSFWRIVDVEDCLLVPAPVAAVLATVRRLARETALPAYDPRTHAGFFRHLLLRQARASGEVLACLVTADGDRAVMEAFADALMRLHPAIRGCYWGINRKVADVAIPDAVTLLRGQPHIVERVGSFQLHLTPLTFLQPSLAQAERIYDAISATAQFSRAGTAWDLYCGAGLVSFYLARRAARVTGIETDARNVEAARANAALNGVTNAEFLQGKVEDLLAASSAGRLPPPGVIVVDPPRCGLHPDVIRGLAAAPASQLFYLSCNAQTLARDLLLLRAAPAWRIMAVRAFDMFPQTTHVETLVRLERS